MSEPPAQPALDALAARRMAMLLELGEMGMELARSLKAQALSALDPDAPAAPKVTDADPVLMFTRVSRAVRQTLALQLRCAHADQAGRTEGWRVEATESRQRRKAEVGEVARMMIEDEGSEFVQERLLAALDARLEADAPDDEDFNTQAVGVMVARICRELGVRPDWSQWVDMPWALAEARAQTPGSPFAGPDAPRVFDDDEGEGEPVGFHQSQGPPPAA